MSRRGVAERPDPHRRLSIDNGRRRGGARRARAGDRRRLAEIGHDAGWVRARVHPADATRRSIWRRRGGAVPPMRCVDLDAARSTDGVGRKKSISADYVDFAQLGWYYRSAEVRFDGWGSRRGKSISMISDDAMDV